MNDTKKVQVIYHEEPSFWAEVPELAGFSAADDDLIALRDKTRRVVHDLYGTHVELDETFAPTLEGTTTSTVYSGTAARTVEPIEKSGGARHFAGRPSEVDAIWYDGTNAEEIATWVNSNGGQAKVGHRASEYESRHLFLLAHGEDIWINEDLWIVKDDDGRFVVAADDDFAALYVEVVDGSRPTDR